MNIYPIQTNGIISNEQPILNRWYVGITIETDYEGNKFALDGTIAQYAGGGDFVSGESPEDWADADMSGYDYLIKC